MAGDLRVVELDFDPIKENLKTFLKGQSYYTDYDFDGSAMSIVLDLLAYDTHYKAFLANMVINERFIDTAVKRASVVSHAKPLGFVPRSVRAARARVNVTVYGTSPTYTLGIGKYTTFSSDINGTKYNFVTTKPYTTTPSGEFNAYTFSNVDIYEGIPVTYSHVVPQDGARSLYKIPAANVDTTTLTVVVQNSASDTTSNVYTYADSVSMVSSTDLVYYLEEGTDGFFHVYFGDDVLGKSVSAGNIIKLSYIVSSGSAANTSDLYDQSFTLTGVIGGFGSANTIIEVTSPSSGGDEKQSIDDIRFLASKNYSAQGKAVSPTDYKTLLKNNFPEIDSITVWGGEDNLPPIYGKVFISIKPKNGFVLTNTMKEYFSAYLKKLNIVTIRFEFVDPDFTYVRVTNNIKFDSDLTTKDSANIESLATGVIMNFFNNTLQQFAKELYISKLQSAVDKIDTSILGNTITIGLQKRIEPVLGLSSSYTKYFNNPITPYSVLSTAFNVLAPSEGNATVAIKDIPDVTPPDPSGTGTLVLFDTTTNTVVNYHIGTVNYATGAVTITSLLVTGFPSTAIYDIRVNCTPQQEVDIISSSNNAYSSTAAYVPVAMQNQILMLDDSIAVPTYYLYNGVSVTATPATKD